MTPDTRTTVEVGGPVLLRAALAGSGVGGDPTRRPHGDLVRFAGRTPAGAVTVQVSAHDGEATVEAWGDGAGWIDDRSAALVGVDDDPRVLTFDHRELDELNRRNPGLRHGGHGCVVDALMVRVIAQRVLASEASTSWKALCRELGDPAPGPFDLQLSPDPERIAQTPTWWFHPYGIDRGRATTLVRVAKHANRLAEVVELALPDAYRRMRAVPGLGPWTVNGAARAALGDPDAIIVADYWISHTVCSWFTGRARGSDEEMLALVEPWIGQRGRVERLIHASGHRIQRFGPGRRTPRIASM